MSTSVEPVYAAPPDIPSKWDIIPIHNSDRGSFKDCRRRWDWSSPARHNLTLRADIHGVSLPLFFGTGIHYALENYYNPQLKRDPVESWKTWFDIQWRGGTVTTDWLDKVYDLKPQPMPGTIGGGLIPQYKVRGLEDILPDPDHNEWDEHFELGVQMMTFYKQYAEANDDFDVLLVEHDFSVPIWNFGNNCIMRAVDTRLDSPNYGKTLEVHARGRMDAIKRDRRSGRIGIIDHKTAAQIGEDYFRKLDTDEQCTSYLWAAQIEASYYDLSYKDQPLEDVIYNTLRKAYPKPPTEVRGGKFSVDRTKESTTFPMLMDWIARNMPGVPLDEKQTAYVDYVREAGDEQFIIRKSVRRNKHQLHNAGRRIYLEALDMLSEPRIYPNLTNDFSCLNCRFRTPCLAKEDGGDWQQLINDNYTTNKDR